MAASAAASSPAASSACGAARAMRDASPGRPAAWAAAEHHANPAPASPPAA